MIHRSQVSIAASLALHILAFLIFAGVRLHNSESVKDEVVVAFVNEHKTTILRRSLPVRPMVSLVKSPKRQSPEQYSIRPGQRSPVDFYYSPSEQIFSEVKSIGREVFRNTDIQKPSVRPQGGLSTPIATELLNEPHQRGVKVQPRVFEGRDLLEDVKLPKPELDIISRDDVLQGFLATVRRKIESKKKYPATAQESEIQGRTGVRMTILKDGGLEKVEIVESSGHEMLDRAALQSVRDAAPFPSIPDAVKLDRVEMIIRLVFRLS